MALKQLVFKKLKKKKNFMQINLFKVFFWRKCSRQIARHLAIQHVKQNVLKIIFE
jgi:hypothetical protein